MTFPFMQGNTASGKTNTLPLFAEYAWDFNNDCFIYRNGKNVIVTGNEALKVWIYKTLKTERYRYKVYENSYGVELEQFIGTTVNNEEAAMQVERYVVEALLVNPYIKSVESIEFTNENDILEFAIRVKTIYGEVVING